MNKFLTIGQLAKHLEISPVAIRYYEKQGLCSPDSRSASGYRLYSPTTTSIFYFIKNAKSVGFSLKEIKSLLKLVHNQNTTSAMIRERSLCKIKNIEQKIHQLEVMKQLLEQWTVHCDGTMSTENCPILQELFKREV